MTHEDYNEVQRPKTRRSRYAAVHRPVSQLVNFIVLPRLSLFTCLMSLQEIPSIIAFDRCDFLPSVTKRNITLSFIHFGAKVKMRRTQTCLQDNKS